MMILLFILTEGLDDVDGFWRKTDDIENDEETEKLMQELELAITRGQHKKASVLAKELALRRVTCTLNQPKKSFKTERPIV